MKPLYLTTRRRMRYALRALAIIALTLLLHVLVANWGRIHFTLPAAPTPDTILSVTIQTPPPAIKATPPAPSPAPIKTPKAARPVIVGPKSDWHIAAHASGSEANVNVDDDHAEANMPPVAAQAPQAPYDAPPSATLKYNVKGLRDGRDVYGSAAVVWHNLGDHYRIEGNASVLFFTLLEFSSDGMLDASGLAPLEYLEKPFRKTPTTTRFEHAHNTITFSASDNRYPRSGGAQDRASVIWQLANMGRSTPEAFVTGDVFEFLVAGARNAEPWQVQVLGLENADAATPLWHLLRLPRANSPDDTIDIWLAPQQQWYPLRIRYTKSNGEFIDMSMSSLSPLSPN